jgi:hypothetical protein
LKYLSGDGGFSGSEFFPGQFTDVEFFEAEEEADNVKSKPSNAQVFPTLSTFKPLSPRRPDTHPVAAAHDDEDDDGKKDGDGASSSSPESTSPSSPKEESSAAAKNQELHSMWLRGGKLPDRAELRLEFRHPPVGAESSEIDADVSDSQACDRVLSKGEARVLD